MSAEAKDSTTSAIGGKLGYDHSAVVAPRRRYPLGEHYTVTTINDFIPVLHPTKVRRSA